MNKKNIRARADKQAPSKPITNSPPKLTPSKGNANDSTQSKKVHKLPRATFYERDKGLVM